MTRKMMLIAGVAGLALAAPASAERGGKKDGAAPRAERQQAAQANRAEQPQRAERQQARQAERPQRAERVEMRQVERAQRIEQRQVQRAERPQRAERQQVRQMERAQRIEQREVRRVERPQRIERQQARQAERAERNDRRQLRQVERPQRIDRAQRIAQRELRRAERPQRVERQQVRRIERQAVEQSALINRQAQRQQARIDRQDIRQDVRQLARIERQALRADNRFDRQLIRAARRNEMRPMREISQQRVSIGQPIVAAALAPVPAIYGTRYVDTSDYYHRYDDEYGYVYRVNRDNNFVSAMYPLFGGYSTGDPWPSMYRSSYVPLGYQPYYYDTPDYYYRYDGNAIYRIDSGTQLISGIVALLLGQSLGVGQLLPSSYGAYNVPLDYRANYYDTDEAMYRYGDGFIYQVDPYSRRIEERYPLYADQYMIGQPWPVAYPGYNVPYAYRETYFDTPQAHYRYANNGIYQVDPTTQLITALVALVSGQNFNIGQPMPSGYSAYNVPLAYRDRWSDNSDDYYRYANGYVYEIDAGSGLIEDAYPVYG